MRFYGVHQNLVIRIEILYDGSMVMFEQENLTTGYMESNMQWWEGWCHGMEESSKTSIRRLCVSNGEK